MRINFSKTACAVMAVLLLVALASVVTARPRPAGATTPTTLYDQSYEAAAVTEVIQAQDFLGAHTAAEPADDFTVPAGTTWSISQVSIEGSVAEGEVGPPPTPISFDVLFYADNAGKPGTLVASRPAAPATFAPVEDYFDYLFTIPVDPVVLSSGSYWLAIEAHLASTNAAGDAQKFFWRNSLVQHGHPAMMLADPTSYPGCGTWAVRTSCSKTFAPDQTFSLSGQLAAQDTQSSAFSNDNPSSYGSPVALIAEVCPATYTDHDPTITGLVRFMEGSALLGADQVHPLAPDVAGHCSGADITMSSLTPGSHTITTFYSGDERWHPSTATFVQVVKCGSNLTGSVGPQKVDSGSVCITNATVSGPITVTKGASLFVTNSTVSGNVTGNSPGAIQLCGGRVSGVLSVASAAGPTLIGDDTSSCPGVKISGGVTLNSNTGGVRVAGDQIGGNTGIRGNQGSRTEISHNAISGGLSCTNNVPNATNGGTANKVIGSRSGECASSTF